MKPQYEFNADDHFVIGSNHVYQSKPCQDHTLSGMIQDAVFATISDGCSSGGETSTGARILNYATAQVLRECAHLNLDDLTPSFICEKVKTASKLIGSSMGLVIDDMDATLLYALVTREGGFVHIFGDGCVSFIYHNGTQHTYHYSWKRNTPFYPYYEGNKLSNFMNVHKDDEECFTITELIRLSDGKVINREEHIPLAQAVKGYSYRIGEDELSNLKCIVLCSDGVVNFRLEKELLPIIDIVEKATSFKQWNGEFVKRRLGRMLRDLSEEGIVPFDDVSIAAIHIGAQKEIDDNAQRIN